MPVAVEKLHPLFGAEIEGVDIAAGVDPATFAEIRAAFEEHSVLRCRIVLTLQKALRFEHK